MAAQAGAVGTPQQWQERTLLFLPSPPPPPSSSESSESPLRVLLPSSPTVFESDWRRWLDGLSVAVSGSGWVSPPRRCCCARVGVAVGVGRHPKGVV